MTELSVPVPDAATFFSEGTRDLKWQKGKRQVSIHRGKISVAKKKTKTTLIVVMTTIRSDYICCRVQSAGPATPLKTENPKSSGNAGK